MGERGGALHGLERGLDVAADLVDPALGQAALQQLQAAADSLQHVVEVVRDAAGELADRLHLLALVQRRLDLPALQRLGPQGVGGLAQRRGAQLHQLLQLLARAGQGVSGLDQLLDVGAGAEPAGHRAGLVAHRQRPAEAPAPGAVGTAQAVLGLERLAAVEAGAPGGRRRAEVVGVERAASARGTRQAGAGQRPEAGEVPPAPVVVVVPAVGAGGPDHLRHGVGDGAEPRLAVAQRLGLDVAGGHVLERQDRALHPAGAVAHRHRIEQQVQAVPVEAAQRQAAVGDGPAAQHQRTGHAVGADRRAAGRGDRPGRVVVAQPEQLARAGAEDALGGGVGVDVAAVGGELDQARRGGVEHAGEPGLAAPGRGDCGVALALAQAERGRGLGQGGADPARLAHPAADGGRRAAAGERVGCVDQRAQRPGDAPPVPAGEQQAQREQGGREPGGDRERAQQRRPDEVLAGADQHRPADAGHRRRRGEQRVAVERGGLEQPAAGGDGGPGGRRQRAADVQRVVDAARDHQAVLVDDAGDQRGGQRLALQHAGEGVGREAHGEIVGHATVEHDRHVDRDLRLVGQRAGVEVGHLRPAGGEHPRLHLHAGAHRQVGALGEHGVETLLAGGVGEQDAGALGRVGAPELDPERREVARGERRRGGERQQRGAGHV